MSTRTRPVTKSKVYRARNLPPHADRHAVAQLLTKCIGDFHRSSGSNGISTPAPGLVSVHSLAKSADPWECFATQTATVSFSHEPDLKGGEKRGSGQEWRILVPGLRSDLILDTHFDGFTPLNNAAQHEYDCIAISGLGSHPFGSWQPHGEDKSFMWIRDALPSCLPDIRFLTYGYDTTLKDSTSFQSIPDLAGRFIAHMKSNGWASPTAKPTLFLAHSLGGVLLKQALVMLANSAVTETFMLSLVRGAVFFGVPSQGMEVSHLLAMTKGQPNEALVTDLSVESRYLQNLGMQFDGIAELRNIKLHWAFETKQSPTVVQNRVDGSFSRTGPLTVLVSKDSATNGLYTTQPLSTFQIDEDHSGMVKFSPGNSCTGIVTQILRDITQVPSSSSKSVPSTTGRMRMAVAVDPHVQGRMNIEGSQQRHSEIDRINRKAPPISVTTNIGGKQGHVILASLRAPERDWRLEQIDDVHTHTFSWIYDKRSIGFADWLRKGRGIFWISGKPGSGKSTLMKLIHSDPRTAQLMETWGSRSKNISATFFFHHRGNALQKSFEGLLRGIISQLVEKETQLAGILRNMLVEEYFHQVNSEGLGSLPTDILKLFHHHNLEYGEDDDREIRQMLRCWDSRAQLLHLLAGVDIGGSDSRRAKLVEILVSRQPFLQKLAADKPREAETSTRVDKLDDALGRIFTREEWGVHSKTLTACVRQWLSMMDRKARILRLLGRDQRLGMTEDAEEDILACLFKQKRRDDIFEAVKSRKWSLETLDLALSRILQQNERALNVTLFLDALDEYDGRPEFIAEFLTRIVQSDSPHTNVRLCFSSRPWNAFVERFSTSPGFKIHEHTEDDIRTYCLETLSLQLRSRSALGELVPEIVRRAQGVFLWVRLVVRDLEAESKRHDGGVSESLRTKQLRNVLDSLPDQLSDYYIAIVRRVPPSSRWDTYVLLECVARARWELGVCLAYSALKVSRSETFRHAKKQPQLDSYNLAEQAEEIHTISGGLVEVIQQSEVHDQRLSLTSDKHCLQFMHQTVKEFVQDPEFKYNLLGNLAGITFENGNTFLAKAYFLQDWERVGVTPQLSGFYARQAESTTGCSLHRFISDASRPQPSRFTPTSSDLWMQSTLLYAAFHGLDLYIQEAGAPKAPASTDPNQLSPFDALACAMQQPERKECVEQILQTGKVLLECGHCPTEWDALYLANTGFNSSPDLDLLVFSNCKELHDPSREQMLSQHSILAFERPRLVAYLLESTPTGANATDEKGRTPLDYLIQKPGEGRTALDDPVSVSMEILREHGGCLRTTTPEVFWEKFSGYPEQDFQQVLGITRVNYPDLWLPGFRPKRPQALGQETYTGKRRNIWRKLVLRKTPR